MKKNITFKDNYAISEVLGGLFLLVVAIVAFVIISPYFLPNNNEHKTDVEIIVYVNSEGEIVLQHNGGQSISSYQIIVYDDEGEVYYTSTIIDDDWVIGEERLPYLQFGLDELKLSNSSECMNVIVYQLEEEGSKIQIFDGIICGNVDRIPATPPPPSPPIPPSYGDAMLISSLGDNTSDEDLYCFNYTLTPEINATSFIYSWNIDNNPITDLFMSFDTNNSVISRDYSGNENNGSISGSTWTDEGIIGGAYSFDGINDFISLPYCFNGDYIGQISIESWIKTSYDNVVIASYLEKYWQLAINNGKIVWSTTANDNTVEINGVTSVSDDIWHHIVVVYDFSTGNSEIYIDGKLDKSESTHNPGDVLGDGSTPTGYIGLGSVSTENEIIFSTSFEDISEEDEWSENDYRTTAYWWEWYFFDRLASDSITPRTGSFSIGGSGDFDPRFAAYDRNSINISEYSNVKVSVWYSYKNTECTDEIGLYYWDGSGWEPIFEDFCPDVGEGNQLDWTYAEANIPDSIDELTLELLWSTSQWREYVAIDDLQITGTSDQGIDNFSGLIDDFKIYNRVLSDEQIYQNYLCTKDGLSDKSVIVSDETTVGQIWRCDVTPNDSTQDDSTVQSNSLQIIGYGGG